MSVNKFGMSLRRGHVGGDDDDDDATALRETIASLRNHVRNSALILNDDSYDARGRKIRRVSAPTDDTDATNRSYLTSALRGESERIRGDSDSRFATIDRTVEGLRRNVVEIVVLLAKEGTETAKFRDDLKSRLATIDRTVEGLHRNVAEIIVLLAKEDEETAKFRGDLDERLATMRNETTKFRDDFESRLVTIRNETIEVEKKASESIGHVDRHLLEFVDETHNRQMVDFKVSLRRSERCDDAIVEIKGAIANLAAKSVSIERMESRLTEIGNELSERTKREIAGFAHMDSVQRIDQRLKEIDTELSDRAKSQVGDFARLESRLATIRNDTIERGRETSMSTERMEKRLREIDSELSDHAKKQVGDFASLESRLTTIRNETIEVGKKTSESIERLDKRLRDFSDETVRRLRLDFAESVRQRGRVDGAIVEIKGAIDNLTAKSVSIEHMEARLKQIDN